MTSSAMVAPRTECAPAAVAACGFEHRHQGLREGTPSTGVFQSLVFDFQKGGVGGACSRAALLATPGERASLYLSSFAMRWTVPVPRLHGSSRASGGERRLGDGRIILGAIDCLPHEPCTSRDLTNAFGFANQEKIFEFEITPAGAFFLQKA